MPPPKSPASKKLSTRRLEELLPQKIEETLRQREESKTPSLSIIATKGTLDWAYPPFILASTAAALGWDVQIFFTFYGLNLLKKDVSDLKISPLGNPGMPMKMPFGPDWFKGINWNIPNLIQAGVPGFESIATTLMAADDQEQRRGQHCRTARSGLEAGVKFIACQMTVDLFGFTHDDLLPGLEYCGAATFLPNRVQRTSTVHVAEYDSGLDGYAVPLDFRSCFSL